MAAEAATAAVTVMEAMEAVLEAVTVEDTKIQVMVEVTAAVMEAATEEVMVVVGNVTMEDGAEDVAGAEVVDVVEVGAEEVAFAFNFRGKAPVRLEISADFRTADSTLSQFAAPHSKIKHSHSTRNFSPTQNHIFGLLSQSPFFQTTQTTFKNKVPFPYEIANQRTLENKNTTKSQTFFLVFLFSFLSLSKNLCFLYFLFAQVRLRIIF